MNDDLQTKLNLIEKVFHFDEIRNLEITDEYIRKYYKANQIAYSLFHTRTDLIYMGISRDGVYKEDDLKEHSRILNRYIKSTNSENVLELASGRGANSTLLAEDNPNCKFYGVDLSPGQLYFANKKAKKLNNFFPKEGDYHNLEQFKDNTFDIVFVVEALCYSVQKEIVLKEVFRVLKPNGLFIIFDGYHKVERSTLNEDEELASVLVEKTMALENFEWYDSFIDKSKKENFTIYSEEDVSQYVLPTMKRFEKLAKKYFKSATIANALKKILPKEFVYNSIAGLLMPTLIEKGQARYMITVLQKKLDQ